MRAVGPTGRVISIYMKPAIRKLGYVDIVVHSFNLCNLIVFAHS